MPVINTFGALTYSKFSTYSFPSGDGYIFTGPGYGFYAADDSGTGTGIDIDSNGNLYVGTTLLGNTYFSGSAGYAVKLDSNGNTIYNITTNLGVTPVVTDDDDVYFAGISATLPNGIPTYAAINLKCDDGNQSISVCNYTGNMVNAYNFPDIYGIRTDNANNTFVMYGFGLVNEGKIYKNISNNTTSNQILYSSNIGGATSLTPQSFCIDPNNNMYLMGTIVGETPPTGSYITKIDSSFTTQWRVKLSVATGYDIAADANNCYVTYQGGILKLDGTNGNVLISKGPVSESTKITVGSDGNIYTLGTNLTSLDSNLNVNWQNSFVIQVWGSALPGGTIGIITDNNYIYGASTYRGKLFGFKVPIDGSIPNGNPANVGIYSLIGYYVRYYATPYTANNTGITSTSTTNVKVTSGGWTFDTTTSNVGNLTYTGGYTIKQI